jgi:hypothetical protein
MNLIGSHRLRRREFRRREEVLPCQQKRIVLPRQAQLCPGRLICSGRVATGQVERDKALKILSILTDSSSALSFQRLENFQVINARSQITIRHRQQIIIRHRQLIGDYSNRKKVSLDAFNLLEDIIDENFFFCVFWNKFS